MSYSKMLHKIQSVSQNLIEVRKKREQASIDCNKIRLSSSEHQQILELEKVIDDNLEKSQCQKDYFKYSEEYCDLDKTLDKLISDLWRLAKDGADPDFDEVK